MVDWADSLADTEEEWPNCDKEREAADESNN